MSARAWSAFAGVSILWGIPYLFIKVGVDDGVPPVFLAWVRVTLAAVVLVALAAHRPVGLPAVRPRLRDRRRRRHRLPVRSRPHAPARLPDRGRLGALRGP
jgi:drug/metabolite transporter (DMT)-like permease